MNPKVSFVKPLEGSRLQLQFSNGEQRLFNVGPYLDKGVFQQLREVARFDAVRVVAGSVEWPGQIDLSYDTLYMGSTPL